MKFGPVPVSQAEGAIVAHAVHRDTLTLKKGDIVRRGDIAALEEAGVQQIVVARLDSADVAENDAARLLAEAIGGAETFIDRAFTGRANLFARCAGVLRIHVPLVDRINAVTESITLATLPQYRTVVTGEMIATVKIIPFAVPSEALERALAVASAPLIDVARFRPMRVGVISTVLPGLKASVMAKTLAHLADRLEPAGATIVADERVSHEVDGIGQAIRRLSDACDLIVIFGASAITDRRDVIPAALVDSGGVIEHFGMPVDPGNLLLLGRIGATAVIGAPGCARSPKENGFDWVLHRLLAGIEVTSEDLRRLGVGGLLMEIVSRPQPRSAEPLKDAPKQPAERDVGQRSEAAP